MKKLLTKRMINLHNTSDEYHTANEDSFSSNSLIIGGSPALSTSIGTQHQQSMVGTPNTVAPTTLAARKQVAATDPNEPTKPLSAYALFFRDTVSAIKQQNPTCSFQELSKIVASMWEALDPNHKAVYNKKNETAKNEYIKQMRIYREQQEEKLQQAAQMPDVNPPPISPAVFTMNLNSQQQQLSSTTNNQQQEIGQNSQQSVFSNTGSSNNTNSTGGATTNGLPNSNANPPANEIQLLNEAVTAQKCTRDNCNKRAIINPDWEDEYCSNECVVIHCRNVFSAWVQSNLEAKQQQQQSDVQQHTAKIEDE